MKLCKDCKHFKPVDLGNTIECWHSENVPLGVADYVHGGQRFMKVIYYDAQYVRENASMCAPEGKWWEAK